MRKRLSDLHILWILIGLYIVIFGLITALRHYNFLTQAWDLGIFTQSFWNASHGRGLINTIEQIPNHLGVHFSPFLFLLVPGYALFQSPYYLLFIQTLALALGALPLFLLTKKILIGEVSATKWALAIVTAYLLYPPLHALQLYDFHEIAFFVPLFLFALYFLETKKWIYAGIFLFLAATTKEDAVLTVLFAGLYLIAKNLSFRKELLFPDRRKCLSIAVIIIIVSVTYFFLATKIFMPAAGGGLLRIDRYAHLGETVSEIAKNSALHPLLVLKTVFTLPKMAYVFWLLFPLLFLPLLSWRSLILVLPGLAENVLTNYSSQFSSLYHYDALVIPGLFISAVYGVKILLKWIPDKKRDIVWAVGIVIFIGFVVRSPLSPTIFSFASLGNSPKKEAYRNLVRMVPEGVSVAAHTNLVPHLAQRKEIQFAGFENERSDIVLLDTTDMFGFESAEAIAHYIESYDRTDEYTSYVFDDRYIVLLSKKLRLSGLPAKTDQNDSQKTLNNY